MPDMQQIETAIGENNLAPLALVILGMGIIFGLLALLNVNGSA